MSGVERLYGRAKAWQLHDSRAKERIDLAHIGAIEQIESLSHEIELSALADWDVLENSEVYGGKP